MVQDIKFFSNMIISEQKNPPTKSEYWSHFLINLLQNVDSHFSF